MQECVLALQTELNRRGHQAWVITPAPRGVEADPIPERVILLGGAADVRSFHTTAQVSVGVDTEAIDEALTHHKFDVLHFHEPWVPILSRQLLVRNQGYNVATFHAKLPDTVMTRTIERVITPYTSSILRYFDDLTAVSDAAAHYVRELTEDQVEIIPNGIDLKYYRPAKRVMPHPPTILYIGRLEKRKGIKYLIQAYATVALRHPEVRIQIAGDGPDREKLETLCATYGLKNVEFLGFVTKEQKLNLLQQADLFCSPAVYGESFGIVLLEAMACGLPIVAGDNMGYSSVLRGRGQLSLVDPKHTEDFARRIELLLFDQDLRKLWLKWAAEYVGQFSYQNVTDRYEKLYKSLASKR